MQYAGAAEDPELERVYEHVKALDPAGRRFGRVLRDTIDQLLNGEVTGRYDWKTLFKTEKTHAGTLVEINLQRESGSRTAKPWTTRSPASMWTASTPSSSEAG